MFLSFFLSHFHNFESFLVQEFEFFREFEHFGEFGLFLGVLQKLSKSASSGFRSRCSATDCESVTGR